MGSEEIEANKALWNARVEVHVGSKFYDVESFTKGKTSLNDIELEALGKEVKGKSLLHLQCHFGMDTLSWARMGASVTGIDFSSEAIRTAKQLSKDLGIEADFVESDVYHLPEKLDKKFEIVFTSYGVLGWLPDLSKWARVVDHFLEPGATFYIVEFHPHLYVYEFETLKCDFPYFNLGPIKEEEEGTYTDGKLKSSSTSYWWNHSLSETIQSLLDQGLILESFEEFPYSVYNCFPNLESEEDGKFFLKGLKNIVPVMFALKMKKPV